VELKVSVSEALELIKEIENVPAKILEYIGMNIQKEVGVFLTNLMGKELTDWSCPYQTGHPSNFAVSLRYSLGDLIFNPLWGWYSL
jgi:hypothetical protein